MDRHEFTKMLRDRVAETPFTGVVKSPLVTERMKIPASQLRYHIDTGNVFVITRSAMERIIELLDGGPYGPL